MKSEIYDYDKRLERTSASLSGWGTTG